MNTYKIIKWDVYSAENIIKLPKIYIDDKTVLSLEKKCEVVCEVKNTNTIYDSKIVKGIILPDYSIILDFTWNGYPDPCNKGTITFHDFIDSNKCCYYYGQDTNIYSNYPDYC